jgi:RNA processing factor Prp31
MRSEGLSKEKSHHPARATMLVLNYDTCETIIFLHKTQTQNVKLTIIPPLNRLKISVNSSMYDVCLTRTAFFLSVILPESPTISRFLGWRYLEDDDDDDEEQREELTMSCLQTSLDASILSHNSNRRSCVVVILVRIDKKSDRDSQAVGNSANQRPNQTQRSDHSNTMADSRTLFTLLECAAGYALFEVVAFEEIGSLLEGSMDTVTDLKRFGRAVKLKAFLPFESAQVALENANAISEHAMTEALHDFLEMNLPKKAKKYSLGVIDPGLATAISDGLGGVSCRSDDTVREIMRGCRMHLETFVKGLDGGAAEKAQLGLGHSYSRSKVKFNPARSDNMIIQSIALLDQMDKDLNTFAMRVREWYSWHFPELKDIVKDNIMFARAAAYIQDKATVCHSGGGDGEDDDEKEDKLPGLIEIVGDEDTAKAIQAAARTSMGMDCSAVDMVNIINFTQRMVKLAEFRKNLSNYLTEKMNVVAPNLSALIGDTVGARLISKVCTVHS